MIVICETTPKVCCELLPEEELDDDEERHLPGDDGLQPGRGEHPVQVEHQVTCKQQSNVIICKYQQLHLEIRD